MFATSLSLHPTRRDPRGRVISKIQHHLVLYCSRSPTPCPTLAPPAPGPLLSLPPQTLCLLGLGFDLVRVSDASGLSKGCFKKKSLCASVCLQRSRSLLHNSWRNSVKTSSKPQIICEMQLETIFVDLSHCKHPFPLLHHTFYSCVLKPGKISS